MKNYLSALKELFSYHFTAKLTGGYPDIGRRLLDVFFNFVPRWGSSTGQAITAVTSLGQPDKTVPVYFSSFLSNPQRDKIPPALGR